MTDERLYMTYILGDPRNYDPKSFPIIVMLDRNGDYVSYMRSIGYEVWVSYPDAVKMKRPPRVSPNDLEGLLDSGEYPKYDFISSKDINLPTVISNDPNTGEFKIYSWEKEELPTGEAVYRYKSSTVAYGAVGDSLYVETEVERAASVYGDTSTIVEDEGSHGVFSNSFEVLKAIYCELKELENELYSLSGVGDGSGSGLEDRVDDLEDRVDDLEGEMGEVADKLTETNQILGEAKEKFIDLIDNKLTPLFGEDGILSSGKSILGGFLEYVSEHALPNLFENLSDELMSIMEEMVDRDAVEGLEHMFDKMDWSWED